MFLEWISLLVIHLNSVYASCVVTLEYLIPSHESFLPFSTFNRLQIKLLRWENKHTTLVLFCSALLGSRQKYLKRTRVVSTEFRVHQHKNCSHFYNIQNEMKEFLSRSAFAFTLKFSSLSSTWDDNSKENIFHTHQNCLLFRSAFYVKRNFLLNSNQNDVFTHLIFVQNEWNGSFKWKFGLES